MMSLKEYLEGTSGIGVLSTADAEGKVDAAIYSTPHVFDDGNIAFVMRERLTHRNLQSNPHASFLFVEHGQGYRWVRLFIYKTKEETDAVLIARMPRRGLTPEEDKQKRSKFLASFTVQKILALIGGAENQLPRSECTPPVVLRSCPNLSP
jgi:hypothetical protein